MKQLLILSGKGGTGKTTVATSLIKLSKAKAYADCDVDAPNLHLLMNLTNEPKRSDYYGLPKAKINALLCTNCGLCKDKCRFNAIKINERQHEVDGFACEGCGVCEAICPVGAISLNEAVAGELMLYQTSQVFSTAKLKMGSGTSGMLVTEVKKQMKSASNAVDLAIIDGSPGIGCPVIASLSGVDMVLIVTEPSISGISDMERIIKTANGFGTSVAVCVNKYDTNKDNTQKIKQFCQNNTINFVGEIPYDPEAVKTVNEGKSVVDVESISGTAIREIYSKTMRVLFGEKIG